MTTTTDLTTLTDTELRQAIREAAAKPFSTVGDERAQHSSIRQWSAPITPLLEEVVRRDVAGLLDPEAWQ